MYSRKLLQLVIDQQPIDFFQLPRKKASRQQTQRKRRNKLNNDGRFSFLALRQSEHPRWNCELFFMSIFHFSFLQNPNQNQLCELLNTYMRNGVPKSKSSYIISELHSEEALDALYDLPQSWRDFVNACDISETDMKIQSAIWELVTTEVDYIHAIQTVTDVSLTSFLIWMTRELISRK